ncbi:MAG: VOC family protein [Nitriliruptorales bacterium]|nr:VOC family protein [Nitriliruptorales bacterium]
MAVLHGRHLHVRRRNGAVREAVRPAVDRRRRQGVQPVGGRSLVDDEAIEIQRQRIRDAFLRGGGVQSSARGVHHVVLLSSNVERTVRFYQDTLGFPLTEIFENRDYRGSSHFFFDLGNGNLLAFFDFPGLDLGTYAEVLGGLHHVAISMEPEQWEQARQRLDDTGVEYRRESGTSIYFKDPDGARIELIADPLGEMYGAEIL